jgi:CelD/BcsL family acetyltransferase involved in cellulose biosynthesis
MGMQLELHTSFPDELEAEWNELVTQGVTQVPFLRFECMKTWWQTRGGGEWPEAELAIVTARKNGDLAGIAPLFCALHQEKSALMLLGSIEVFDYLDLIVRQDDLAAFVSALMSFIEGLDWPHWQVLDLYNILDHSPSLKALEDAALQRRWSFRAEKLQPSPYIPLPGDWETYLAGIKKKQRHEIRRKIRRLEEADVYSRWYILDDPDKLDAEMEEFLNLMSQDPVKAPFLTDLMKDHMCNIARCACEKGFLQLSFLEIDGQKAAAKMAFNYQNRLLAYNSGVDRRFWQQSPGWVLLGYLLRWAIENGFEEFDFMRGDEEYKYRFGALDRFVMRATLER